MLNVLHIRSTFQPGGTESLLLNLFNYNQNKIHFSYLFIKEGELISKLFSNQNNYYVVRRKYKIDFSIFFKAIKIIKRDEIKIIHTHQAIELFYAIILKIFVQGRVQVIHTIHGFNFKNRLFLVLEIFLTKFVKRILTVSESAKKYLENYGFPKEKIQVLYNAVKISDLQQTNKLIFEKGTNDFYIVMIGNFVPEKDQKTLLFAFKILIKRHPRLKLYFIGDDRNAAADNLKKEINSETFCDRIVFCGSVINAYEILFNFDLFVLSSFSETFGIAVIEALMSNIPVLASDIEVMKELSMNGKYFKLFETGNHNDLANRIEWFMDTTNKKEIKSIIHEASLYAKETFNYDNYINRLLKIYEL